MKTDHWSYNTQAARELAAHKRTRKRIMSTLGVCLFAAATNMRVQDVPIGARILSTDPLTLDKSKCSRRQSPTVRDADLSLLD